MHKKTVGAMALLAVAIAALFSMGAAPKPKFDVTSFGAGPDDSTDDTIAITKCFAEASAAAPCQVVIPRGVYYVAGSVGNPAIELTGDQITIVGDGTIKMVAGDDCDSVLEISGDYCWVEGITVDGNASGTPTGRGECIRISGNYNTLHGVTAQNSKSTGGTGLDFFIGDDTFHNVCIDCTSISAGQAGFDDRGEFTTIRDCKAINFGKYGYSKGGGHSEEVTIDGFYAESNAAAAYSGLIIDPGPVDNYVVERANVRNVRIQNIPNSIVYAKFARVHDLSIEGMYIEHDELVSSIKIVEACKTVSIRDSFFSRAIDFDEGAGVTGPIASVGDDGTGNCRFTDASHGLLVGDIIYIPDSSVSGYNGLHEVLATTTNTFDTDCRYSSTATGNWYGATGAITLDNVTVGDRTQTAFRVSGMRTPRFKARNVTLLGCSTKAFAPKNSYPITAVERYDIENCFAEFDRDTDSTVICFLTGETNSTEYFTESRKLRWVNNSYRNLGTGTVQTLYSPAGQILATSPDGDRTYYSTSAPTTGTWYAGDRVWVTAPDISPPQCFICVTSGTPGTWRPLEGTRALYTDTSGVSSSDGGEDTLCNYTIAAGQIAGTASEQIVIDTLYTFAADSDNKQVKLKFGGTTIYDSGTAAHNGGALALHAVIACAGSTSSQYCMVQATSTGTGTPIASGAQYTNTSVNTSNAVVITSTGTGTTGADITQRLVTIRLAVPETENH